MSKGISKVTKIFKKVAPIAGLALGGAGLAGIGPLAGVLGGAGGLSNAGSVLGIINGAQTILSGETDQKGTPVEEVQAAQAPAFSPTRPDAMARPAGLSELGSYAPEQERSALATKGLNQGLGDDEQAYYKNLIQRSLIGDGNKVTGSVDSLLPVEQQYFGQQGYNMGDIHSFLQGISK